MKQVYLFLLLSSLVKSILRHNLLDIKLLGCHVYSYIRVIGLKMDFMQGWLSRHLVMFFVLWLCPFTWKERKGVKWPTQTCTLSLNLFRSRGWPSSSISCRRNSSSVFHFNTWVTTVTTVRQTLRLLPMDLVRKEWMKKEMFTFFSSHSTLVILNLFFSFSLHHYFTHHHHLPSPTFFAI